MAPHYAQGTYPATITAQGFAESQYGWQFVLKLLPETDGNQHERTVFLALTDEDGNRAKYADKTMDVFRYLGFGGGDADLAQLDPEADNHYSFVGMAVEAYCQHKESDSGTKERWYINTPRSGSTEITKPDNLALRKLQDLFGRELKETPETPVPASIAPAPPPIDSDEATDEAVAATTADGDIPF